MASISLKYKSKQGNLTAPGDVDLGAMIPIATVTVGAGGTTGITFSSIPSTYEHLQIRGILKTGTETTGPGFYFNNVSSGTSYAYHNLIGSGSSVTASGASSQSYDSTMMLESATANTFTAFIIDILDYANTNKYKTVRALTGLDKNGSGELRFHSSLYQSTDVINRIDFYDGYTFSQYSSFALYGIKRAGA